MRVKGSLFDIGGGLNEKIKPGEILVNTLGSFIYSDILPRGSFDLFLAAGGGRYSSWAFNGYGWGANGGSGSVWEGVFFNPKKQPIEIVIGGYQAATTFSLDGKVLITCNQGTNAATNSAGKGGIISVDSTLQIINPRKIENGKDGSIGLWSGTAGESVSSKGWGAGGNSGNSTGSPGGALLTYLSSKKLA